MGPPGPPGPQEPQGPPEPEGPQGPPGEAAPTALYVPSEVDVITAFARAGGILIGVFLPPPASRLERWSRRSIAMYFALACSEGRTGSREDFEAFVVDQLAPSYRRDPSIDPEWLPSKAFDLFGDLRGNALAGDTADCMRPYSRPQGIQEAQLAVDLVLTKALPLAGLNPFEEWFEQTKAPQLVYEWFQQGTLANKEGELPPAPLLHWLCLGELLSDCLP